MLTEEFILIKTKICFTSTGKIEVLGNPLYKQKTAQLPPLQRNQSNSMRKPQKALEADETANKVIKTAKVKKHIP